MKVIAINSSPHRDRGGTGRILGPFLDGMKQAGADVNLVHVHGLDIRPCLGCLDCWVKTPGRCIQDDAMTGILSLMAESDVMVLATPLYVDGMNAAMKGLLDRSIPLLQPWFVLADDHCRHDRVEKFKAGKVALVSVCGFTELDNFDPLVAHAGAVSRNMRREFVGALLRPYANSLPELAEAGVDVEDIYGAAREAGEELVRDGAMRAETLGRVSRDLVSRDRYIQAVNVHFRQALRRSQRPA